VSFGSIGSCSAHHGEEPSVLIVCECLQTFKRQISAPATRIHHSSFCSSTTRDQHHGALDPILGKQNFVRELVVTHDRDRNTPISTTNKLLRGFVHAKD
jgi:hypothetical protein